MRCICLLLVSLATVSCLYPGIDAPIPTLLIPTESACYYSCLVGSKWVYELKGVEGVETYVVTTVREAEGAKYVTVMKEGKEKFVPFEEVKVSAQGLVRVGSDEKKDEFPICWLKLPIKPGERWDDPRSTGLNAVITCRGLEYVKVPAGIYRAIRVDYVEPIPPCIIGVCPSGKSTIWFAPDVGIVKRKSDHDGEFVLKSFTPGKENLKE